MPGRKNVTDALMLCHRSVVNRQGAFGRPCACLRRRKTEEVQGSGTGNPKLPPSEGFEELVHRCRRHRVPTPLPGLLSNGCQAGYKCNAHLRKPTCGFLLAPKIEFTLTSGSKRRRFKMCCPQIQTGPTKVLIGSAQIRKQLGMQSYEGAATLPSK